MYSVITSFTIVVPFWITWNHFCGMYSVITSFTIVVAFWITWNHFCCMHNVITSFTVVVAFWKGEENNNSKQIMFKILWNQLPLYPLNRYCFCNCFICAMLFLWHNSKQIMFKILWNQLPLYPLNRYCFCNCFICAMLFLWHKCILKGQYHEVPRATLFTILWLEFWTYRCWKWFFFFLPAIKTEFFIEQIPPLLNSLF